MLRPLLPELPDPCTRREKLLSGRGRRLHQAPYLGRTRARTIPAGDLNPVKGTYEASRFLRLGCRKRKRLNSSTGLGAAALAFSVASDRGLFKAPEER